ncbi:TIGR03619 family F420-dependent LLM class oxidoreductase [Streptomyces sp. NPDC048409]|uniref:TIGR03619 family F420-dependent LLM class oxidoreductase n=1 Tax=Streptomyces sp. NPDC048409 TaxID=3154723 RepID=UPI0034344CE9
MDIGFTLPQFHRQASEIDRAAEFSKTLEDAGAASLWVGDRNLAAVHPSIGYGGFGNTIPEELNPAADPFALLAVAASATDRVRLGTHVLIAPLYPVVQLARSLTSIDRISGGRLIPGFGIGWSPEEYEAASVRFDRRGALLDEQLDALHEMWTRDPAGYRGKLLSVPEHHSPLKPIQDPHPPIYLGGVAEAALRRVGERADGWLPFCAIPSFVDVGSLKDQQRTVEDAARAAGRDLGDIDAVLRINIDVGAALTLVATTVRQIAEETAISHFVFDTTYSASGVDHALTQSAELLALLQ